MAPATATRAHDALDISSHAFWALPPAEREPVFAELRRDRPLSWHRPAETDLLPNDEDPRFWAAVTHADIVAVSRDAETWGSASGTAA